MKGSGASKHNFRHQRAIITLKYFQTTTTKKRCVGGAVRLGPEKAMGAYVEKSKI